MALSPELRLYDPAGERQPLPEKFFLGCNFELLPRGGFGTFTLNLVAELDDDAIPYLPEANSKFEVWFHSACAFRGWVENPNGGIEKSSARFSASGVGLVGRLPTLLVDAAYAKAYGADVSEVYAWIAGKYLVGSEPTERLGDLAQVIASDIGYTVERVELFGTDVRAAFDKLAEASQDLLIWGIDTTPAGENRLYVQARPTTVSNEDYRFRVGDDIAYVEQPEDLSELVNAVRLVGGEAKTPNLVFNPSFELPALPGEGKAGNLLTAGDFETAGGWTYGGTAARQQTAGEPGEYSRSGSWFGEIDASGDLLEQTVTLITGGADVPYKLVVHYAKQNAATDPDFTVRLRELKGDGTVLNTLINETVTAEQRSYQRYEAIVETTDALTAKLELRISYSGPANSVLIDDVFLHEADAIAQRGWNHKNRGTGKVKDLEWAHENNPFHGAYCVKVRVAGADPGGDDDNVWIRPFRWIQAREKTAYVLKVRVRTTSALKMRLGVQYKKSEGGVKREWSAEKTTDASGNWETLSATLTVGSDVQRILPVIELRSDGTYRLDAVELYESGIETRSDFLPGGQLEYYLRADDAATLPGLTAEAQASIATYGLRETVLEIEQITDRQQALDYATGYLNRYAVPVKRGVVVLDPCDVHVRYVADDAAATPQGLVAISGARIPIPDQWPAAVRYSVGPTGAVRCEVDLTNRRPDPLLLLLRVLDPDRGRGGGGSPSSPNLRDTPGNGGEPGSEEGGSLSIRVDGSTIGTRSAINLKAGTAVTLTGLDDDVDDEGEVTVAVNLGTGAGQAAAGNHSHAHSALTGISANDHHNQVHAFLGGDHTGAADAAEARTTLGLGGLATLNPAAADPNDTIASSPTYMQAAFDALVAEVHDLKDKLRTAGIITP